MWVYECTSFDIQAADTVPPFFSTPNYTVAIMSCVHAGCHPALSDTGLCDLFYLLSYLKPCFFKRVYANVPISALSSILTISIQVINPGKDSLASSQKGLRIIPKNATVSQMSHLTKRAFVLNSVFPKAIPI